MRVMGFAETFKALSDPIRREILMMLRDGWFSATLNLVHPDPACAELDHITGSGRNLDISCFASNNFAFGGVNTSLIFKRVP